MKEWIQDLLSTPSLRTMGHGQRIQDANLGLGWLYYALTRATKARTVVVIGSYRGFVPIVIAKAMKDNLEGGRLIFIDPSLVDEFWKDLDRVNDYFARYGTDNIQHFKLTTEEFCETDVYEQLNGIDLLFIDGLHTYKQVRADFEAFEEKMADSGVVLFHDTATVSIGKIYGSDNLHVRNVPRFIQELRMRSALQVFDLHCAEGIAFVSKIPVPRDCV